MSNPNPDTNFVKVLASESIELHPIETTRCVSKLERKMNRLSIASIWISSILALALAVYCAIFLRDDGNSIPATERKSLNQDYLDEFLNGTCRTRECIIAASQIRDSIDSRIEPCTDFYEYVCGNSLPQRNPFLEHEARVQWNLKRMIENGIGSEESKAFELVGTFYNSCMNQAEIEAIGLKQFNEIIRKIGGWPIIEGEQWNETSYDWVESIRQMREVGLDPGYLFHTQVEMNFKNSSIRSITISQPGFFLPRYLSRKHTVMYLRYYADMLISTKACGAHSDSFVSNGMDLMAFERALTDISLPDEELHDYEAIFNPFKVSELQIKYPYIRWMDYFDALLPVERKITLDEVVTVATPAYFDRLAEVLQKASNRTIANFFAWRILFESLRFLKDPNREPAKEDPYRWSDCVKITTELLTPAIGALYTRENPKDQHSMDNVRNLVRSIRGSFIDMLHNATWMDGNTRRAAEDKAKSTNAYIGFPKELSNITKLEEHYKSLTLNRNEFFMNVLRLKKFIKDYSFRQLHEPVDKDIWLSYAMLEPWGASYIKQKNEILIPATMFRGAFISTDRPNYMNYGAMGSIIGHEIAHGFDDVGMKLDKNGNLLDWWLPETKWKFLNKTKCIIEQYGNFTEPTTGMNVNGKLTQNENIADNIGLKSAYYAYTKWLEHNEDKPLPGLKHYTSKQMFWISAAQTSCTRNNKELMASIITSGIHSPHRFRVIGPMRNSKEFAEDFKCAQGTPMNPIEKCEIW